MKRNAWLWACGVGLLAGLLAAAALHRTAPQATPASAAAGPPEALSFRPDATPPDDEAKPASREATPLRATPLAPAETGETLVYDVAWAMVNAGTITISARSERDEHGAAAYHIVAEGKVAAALASVYPLYYKAEAIVDPATLLPRKAWVYQQEGRRRRTRITVFDHAARRARFEQVGGRQAEFATPAEVWDSLSALYALRAAPSLAPGARLSMPVSDSGRLYTAELSVGPSEDVVTPLGHLQASRITARVRTAAGEPEPRPIALWLSSDTRRLPVKIEVELAVGSFKVALREVKGG